MLQTSPKRDFFPTKQLVHLQQQGIACSNFQRLLDAIGVGHQQIVSNDLLILETDCWWKIWMKFLSFCSKLELKIIISGFFLELLFPNFWKIMEKLWHDWIFLENLELKIMSQMDTNGWICNRLHLRMDSFNKNFDWGSWTSECYWSSLAMQEKNRPSLGQGRTWTQTKVWHQDMVFFRIYGNLTGAKYEKPWGFGPNFETYPRLNRAIFPNHHWKWLERPCQLPPWTACKRPSHLGQRDPGDFFIGTPIGVSQKMPCFMGKAYEIKKATMGLGPPILRTHDLDMNAQREATSRSGRWTAITQHHPQALSPLVPPSPTSMETKGYLDNQLL